MKVLSARARTIQPSITLAISARAKQMKADGVPVLNFSAGEPDFDTPDESKRVAQTEDSEGGSNPQPCPQLILIARKFCQ